MGYLIKNNISEEVIKHLKYFINNVEKPEFLHTDDGGKFTSNLFKLFCQDNKIKLIHGSAHHRKSKGVVESFNKTIIQKNQ